MTTKAAPSAVLPEVRKKLVDQFVKGPLSAEAVLAASMAFKNALIERALRAELSPTTWATRPARHDRTTAATTVMA